MDKHIRKLLKDLLISIETIENYLGKERIICIIHFKYPFFT